MYVLEGAVRAKRLFEKIILKRSFAKTPAAANMPFGKAGNAGSGFFDHALQGAGLQEPSHAGVRLAQTPGVSGFAGMLAPKNNVSRLRPAPRLAASCKARVFVGFAAWCGTQVDTRLCALDGCAASQRLPLALCWLPWAGVWPCCAKGCHASAPGLVSLPPFLRFAFALPHVQRPEHCPTRSC